MKQKALILSGIAAGVLLVGLSAQAQIVIFTQNFNSGLSANESFGAYHGGDITSSTYGIVSGIGPDSSPALQEVNGTAGNTGNGYGYAAVQLQEHTVTGNTSANLSDYTLSFDASATAGSLNLQIQTWSLAGFGGTGPTTLNTAPASPGYGNDLTLNSAWTHYSLNLGNATIFPNFSGFDPTGGTWQIAFQQNGGGNGNPANLTMNIDNVELTMVPEPVSIALLGLGLTAGMAFVRRRNA